MKIVIKTVFWLLLLAFVITIGVDLILVNQQVSTARAFYSSTIESLENSNFNHAVLLECEDKANAYGYQFNVQDLSYYFEEEKVPCYYISIKYVVSIPLLNITEDATIKGYAE